MFRREGLAQPVDGEHLGSTMPSRRSVRAVSPVVWVLLGSALACKAEAPEPESKPAAEPAVAAEPEAATAPVAELEAGLPTASILARTDEGLPKLWLVHRALRLRRARPEVFDGRGAYRPIVARGARADHVVAYGRGEDVVVVVPPVASTSRACRVVVVVVVVVAVRLRFLVVLVVTPGADMATKDNNSRKQTVDLIPFWRAVLVMTTRWILSSHVAWWILPRV